jgi:hypothetical protein
MGPNRLFLLCLSSLLASLWSGFICAETSDLSASGRIQAVARVENPAGTFNIFEDDKQDRILMIPRDSEVQVDIVCQSARKDLAGQSFIYHSNQFEKIEPLLVSDILSEVSFSSETRQIIMTIVNTGI